MLEDACNSSKVLLIPCPCEIQRRPAAIAAFQIRVDDSLDMLISREGVKDQRVRQSSDGCQAVVGLLLFPPVTTVNEFLLGPRRRVMGFPAAGNQLKILAQFAM